MPHDFKEFPELANAQMDIYYFESPHKQIFEDFRAKVVKVTDGDTIRVRCDFRDFDFPIRFMGTNAPEMNEPNGKEVQQWLEILLLNEDIDIIINPKNRVDKWGRLLGKIYHAGVDLGEFMIQLGKSTTFEERHEAKVMDLNFILKEGSF